MKGSTDRNNFKSEYRLWLFKLRDNLTCFVKQLMKCRQQLANVIQLNRSVCCKSYTPWEWHWCDYHNFLPWHRQVFTGEELLQFPTYCINLLLQNGNICHAANNSLNCCCHSLQHMKHNIQSHVRNTQKHARVNHIVQLIQILIFWESWIQQTVQRCLKRPTFLHFH